MRKLPTALSLLCLTALSLYLTGCSKPASPKLTNADKKNFMGGPMPESARQKMAERMAAANDKAKATGKPGGTAQVAPPK